MTALAPTPITTPASLTDRAMLVDLTIRQWSAGKTDRQASASVANTFNVDARIGHYYKRLIATDHLQLIRQTATAAYVDHLKRTLPWMDSGSRILSSTGYFDYMAAMREYSRQFDQHLDVFVANYDDLVLDASHRLKNLFNTDDYPRSNEIRSKFALEVSIFPMPAADDFRVAIDPLEASRIQQDIAQAVQTATTNAVNDLVDRIRTSVTHIHDRMSSYTGERAGAFRNSMIENLEELINLVPSLNITGDPRLYEIARQMQDLVLYDPGTLRKDELARADTARTAEEILDKMKDFI